MSAPFIVFFSVRGRKSQGSQGQEMDGLTMRQYILLPRVFVLIVERGRLTKGNCRRRTSETPLSGVKSQAKEQRPGRTKEVLHGTVAKASVRAGRKECGQRQKNSCIL